MSSAIKKTWFDSAKSAIASAKSSVENLQGKDNSNRSSTNNPEAARGAQRASMEGDDSDARPRIVYVAVSRNEDMLAEAADQQIFEVEMEKSFAIALGRKMLKRKALTGWDEMSSGRHHVIRLPVHDMHGNTSYTICFSHAFGNGPAQAFIQKLHFMLDPMIEKCVTVTEALLDSTVLVILPVLERELERANSGLKQHRIENQDDELQAIIERNIEIILERDECLLQNSMAVAIAKKTRGLKRNSLVSQAKWFTTVGEMAAGDASQSRSAGDEQGRGADEPSETAEKKASQLLQQGAKVYVRGLQSATALNGQSGVLDSFIAESKRWRVRMDSGESKDLKAENIEVRDDGTKEKQTASAGTSWKSTFKGVSTPAARVAPPKPAQPPQSPRTRARGLVGTRLSEDQVARAADLILMLEPFVNGRRPMLDDIWKFFDLPPQGCFDESDPVAKNLRGKLNRIRLLLHPDKNLHPDAERTFKFLEQCNQRLKDSCLRGARQESVAERTRREERELHEMQERRKRDEAERIAREEKRRQEEEERLQEEEERLREAAKQAEVECQRRDWLLRDKEAIRQELVDRIDSMRKGTAAHDTSSTMSTGKTVLFDLDEIQLESISAPQETSAEPEVVESAVPPRLNEQPPITRPSFPQPAGPVGKLTVTILAGRDLPLCYMGTQTDAYAVACVGRQRQQTQSLPGRSPQWGATFEFPIYFEDRGLYVSLWREGWGFRLLGDDFLGGIQIPFLDLDDWSGCVIGRMIESSDPESKECMTLELKATIEWL